MAIEPMTAEFAREIAAWRYAGALARYNLAEGDIPELLDGAHAAVTEGGALLGFYCWGAAARVPGYPYGERDVDFGLGLAPGRVGKGEGRRFVREGLAYLAEKFPGRPVRMTVARLNRVAARVYADLGFEVAGEFTARGGCPFWVMRRARERIYDITRALEEGMRVYAPEEAFARERLRGVEADGYALTRFSMSAHCGTHMDAPAHFLREGLAIDQVPMEWLMGPARVINASPEALDEVPFGTRRLLLKSATGRGVTAAQAGALIDRGVKLLGTNLISIAPGDGEAQVHTALLSGGVWVLENLALEEAPEGLYELCCLPLKLKGAEGAPARVVLRACEVGI